MVRPTIGNTTAAEPFMTTEQTVEALWAHQQRGDVFPAEWRGKLDMDEAYRVQLGILERKLGRGERQAGWKVGLTADSMREMFGGKEPVFGYLLESGSIASGHAFRFAELRSPMVENEILVTLSADLSGPDATPEGASRAIGTIAPAFEIVEMRGADMRVDLPLALTDNVAQRAFVHGAASPFSDKLDFGDVRATVRINGEVKATPLGREAIDNQLRTVAWLANALHRYGRRLQAGQRIMTGSFTKPLPVSPGDSFETEFSGIGAVRVSFG
jgi:2-keto-4-pentenoate hydratase